MHSALYKCPSSRSKNWDSGRLNTADSRQKPLEGLCFISVQTGISDLGNISGMA
jgi:hypothetical protein